MSAGGTQTYSGNLLNRFATTPSMLSNASTQPMSTLATPTAAAAPPKPAAPTMTTNYSTSTSGQTINRTTGGIVSPDITSRYVTAPSGAVFDPVTGQIIKPAPGAQVSVASAPSVTQPAVSSQMNSPALPNISELESTYQSNLNLSPEEMAAQGELDRVQDSFRQGYQNIQDQTIPMEFITGQQQSLENRAQNTAQTLQARLAQAQAKRMAALEASKFALERADKATAAAKEETKPYEINGSLIRYNPATGKYEEVYSAPAKAGEGFTLSPGQQRYDAAGNLIASVSAEEQKMTPYQAAQLALEMEKFNYSKTNPANLTVDQAKARQFAGAAEQANTLLASINYDPGFVEASWMPNAFKGEQRQQFEQAARQFVNAVLRRESGATITDPEFLNKYQELIPRAGDTEAVKLQKERARALAVQSIYQAGGYSSQEQTAPPTTQNPFLQGSFTDPAFKQGLSTPIKGSGLIPGAAIKYPTGVKGGQCTTFLHKIVEFPRIGDGKLEKYRSVDRIGIRANEWRNDIRVGDVVVSGDNPTYGHTFMVNAIIPGGKIRVTESNYKGDERVTHDRIVSIYDSKIYGALRGPLKV